MSVWNKKIWNGLGAYKGQRIGVSTLGSGIGSNVYRIGVFVWERMRHAVYCMMGRKQWVDI